MDVIVRRYEEDDYEAVNNILENTFGYRKSNMKDDKSFEYVAVLDNNVVGYFVLNEMKDIVRNINRFHVDYVCVDENYRGLGIGKKMMEEAIRISKEKGISVLELTSGNKRIEAHKLYLSLGFEIRDSAIFRKELS